MAKALAIILTLFLTIFIIAFGLNLPFALGLWKIFEKAGKKPWYAILPFVSLYHLLEISEQDEQGETLIISAILIAAIGVIVTFIHESLGVLVGISAIGWSIYFIVVWFRASLKLAELFGKSSSIGYLIFLFPPIMFFVIGFDETILYSGASFADSKQLEEADRE